MMDVPNTWLEKGIALNVIRSCFELARSQIRIASGFFTIRGWGLIRVHTAGKQTYILVGIENPGADRAKKALVSEILRDLQSGLDRDRRASVQDLVEKMASGRLRLVDARAIDHHAKVYIADRQLAVIASANATGKGLTRQVESGCIVKDIEEVENLVARFDSYFQQAEDLTELLLQALNKWLQLASPWDIYLKTLLCLEDLEETETKYSRIPVSYQRDAIAQCLRQISNYRGAMLVASTGLGKTAIAVHVALRLKKEGVIDCVAVVGPKAVRRTWIKEMRSAGIRPDYFTYQILDRENSSGLDDFYDIIDELNSGKRVFVILDESHNLRNRYRPGFGNKKYRQSRREVRQAFTRIRQLDVEDRLKVLLLTGSPYGKNMDNLNNQLYLLPHTARNRALLDHPGLAEKNWEALDTSDFNELPVVSRLTTAHVARYYAHSDENGTYITFGSERRYVPKIILNTIKFDLSFQKELIDLIESGCFDASDRHLTRRLLRMAWTSSPLALQSLLKRVVDTPGGENAFERIGFSMPKIQREAKISPLISALKNLSIQADFKLQILMQILRKSEGEKIIIYCERQATVVYLEEALKKLRPDLRVAATVEERNEDYEQKEIKEIDEFITRFAPIASEKSVGTDREYDVFVSTDAYGVGVNLQDASVVVNYDIDWTPINVIQRLGRVLRFWHSPRTINSYTLVPDFQLEDRLREEQSLDIQKILERWDNLMERHQESCKLTDIDVLTEQKKEIRDLGDSASRFTMTTAELDIAAVLDSEETSVYFKHAAKLQEYRQYAESLHGDLISAKVFSGTGRRIYLLLKLENKYHPLLFNADSYEVIESNQDKILEAIASTSDTPTAAVDADEIEALSHRCLQNWCHVKGTPVESVIRICTLLLKPQSEGDSLNSIFKS